MVLVNVKGWKDNHPHVPGSRKPEILVSGLPQVSIMEDLELLVKRVDLHC